MSNIMNFTTEEADKIAKEIMTRKTELEKEMKQVEESMKSVTTWWKGTSGEKFSKQYDKIREDVNKLIKCVGTISEELAATSEAKKKEEEAINTALEGAFK